MQLWRSAGVTGFSKPYLPHHLFLLLVLDYNVKTGWSEILFWIINLLIKISLNVKIAWNLLTLSYCGMGRQTVGDIHNLKTLFFQGWSWKKSSFFFPYGRAHFIVSLFQSLMCSSTSAKPPSLFPDSAELWSWLCGTHPLPTLALGLLPLSFLVLICGEHCFSWSFLFFLIILILPIAPHSFPVIFLIPFDDRPNFLNKCSVGQSRISHQ